MRELEHAIERAVILADGASIRVRDLPPEVTQNVAQRPGDDTLDLQEQERGAIERALERFGGNRRQAAEALNISTVTLVAEDEAVRPFRLIFHFDGSHFMMK